MSAEVQVRSPTSPASQDDKGDEKSPKLERKRGSVSKIKVARDKSGKESSFAETLAARPERSLSEKYSIDSSIPASVVEWSFKTFAYFDASTMAWSKDIVRDPMQGEMDAWELRESLVLAGRHEVTDVMVLDLIRLVGKVSHHDVRINFREFVSLCWKGFFEEPPEEDDISDVQDAFEILGGGPGREGEVRKEKLKEFANSAQLTMDVDKFLELVDEDGSGRVDFKEFCELFADSKRDTNLHNTGAVWLRNYEADVEESISQGHDVSGGFLPGSTSRQSTSMQKSPSLSINVTDYNDTAVDETLSPQRSHSRKDLDTRSYSRKELGSDHSGMEQSVTITRHRDSFFGQESTTFPGTPSLQAPKMKKVLQSTLPKFKHSTHNSVDTKCRHGWRCSQMSRNNPRSEGYNYYNVKTNQFQELNSAGVKMRKRGAEFTIKEHSSQRINVRLSSEMRCIRQTKIHASRPRSRAATALDGSFLDTNLGATFTSQDAARPQTVPVTGLSASRKNLPMLRITTRPVSRQDGSDIRRVAEGLLGSRGLASSHGGSVGSTRNYSFKDPDRPRLWRTNMKQPAVDMQTTSDLLKLAASAGLYDGRGFQKEMGPGINFFDND